MVRPAVRPHAGDRVTAISQFTQPTTERLTKLRRSWTRGLTPNVDRVFPLDRVVDAFVYRETGKPAEGCRVSRGVARTRLIRILSRRMPSAARQSDGVRVGGFARGFIRCG